MTRTRPFVLVTVLVSLATFGLGVVYGIASPDADGADRPAPVRLAPEVLEPARRLSAAFEMVAEAATPSVVNISSVRRQSVQIPATPFQAPPFREFFGDRFFERFQAPPQGRERVQQGLGTGVIVSADGHILTNNHVVDGADEITVRTADEREHTAEIVGVDPKTDLAVLKIDANGLTPAVLGDSDALKIGEWVVAAGNPFGLSSTITTGIVSAKGRANVGIVDYEDYIQTDAAINPGNSGGPLLNLRGEVVGINTAIFTRSGGYMGIGFAIPVNMARDVMESLIDEGRVVRGWLGVAIQPLDEALAGSFGFEGEGVLVGDVTADGPAARAGFEPGDIIVRFGDEPVADTTALRRVVAATRPGRSVQVEIVRDGRERTLRVELGELEAELAASGDDRQPLDLGLSIRTLTPDVARQLQLDADQRGVVVTQVEPFSAAARAGLRPRDVIVDVQGREVEGVEAFRAALREHDLARGVRLGVRTGEARRFVLLRSR